MMRKQRFVVAWLCAFGACAETASDPRVAVEAPRGGAFGAIVDPVSGEVTTLGPQGATSARVVSGGFTVSAPAVCLDCGDPTCATDTRTITLGLTDVGGSAGEVFTSVASSFNLDAVVVTPDVWSTGAGTPVTVTAVGTLSTCAPFGYFFDVLDVDSVDPTGAAMTRLSPPSGPIGCTASQTGCAANEAPVTQVALVGERYVSVTEVTQGAFESVMGYNPSTALACGADCPVETLTWHESAAYANALSALDGLPSCYTCVGSGPTVSCTGPAEPATCLGYRLPTEAEWELAARCGDDLTYAGSNDPALVAWTAANSGSVTHPVASLAPNACGLYDLSGNAWERVDDGLATYPGGTITDRFVAPSGAQRVIRGGGIDSALASGSPRVAARLTLDAGLRLDDVGFRLVRALPR